MYFTNLSVFNSCCNTKANPNGLKTTQLRETLGAEMCVLINCVHTPPTRKQLCNTTTAKWEKSVHKGSRSCWENDDPEQSDLRFFP